MGLENIDVTLRGGIEDHFERDFFFQEECIPLYLFPSQDARVLDKKSAKEFAGKKIQLIVPDGNWRQAKKCHRREKILSGVLKYRLDLKVESIYKLRSQKYDYGLSSFEAVSYALGFLEGVEIQKSLLKNLQKMTDQVMISRKFFPN